MEIVKINKSELQVKEWQGKRVVTLTDIDKVHERPDGTAKTRFHRHKDRFILNEDYFVVKPADVLKYTKDTLRIKIPNRGITLLTEQGYSLIVKTYDDDLAWRVQRELVNGYFKSKEVIETLQSTKSQSIILNERLNELVDTMSEYTNIIKSIVEYSTINYKQQQDLLQVARQRVNHLLGGAHSRTYKEKSRMYFKNLWQQFCDVFECGSYKDLNPICFDDAIRFIQSWEYVEE